MTPGWENFYVIVGSSGAALTGIQFVVIALIATARKAAPAGTLSAFATPTVVHFGGALLVSAAMSTPWPSLTLASIVLGMCGLLGVGYATVVIHRARHQTGYKPVWEDWLWYAVLPLASYAVLLVAGLLLARAARPASFGIAAAALALLFVGIHNAWDTVIHIVTEADQVDRPK